MMDFADRLRDLASRAERLAETVSTEEGTKNALVMPFLSILGYDPFDPTEVNPELTADVGVKKGEKVDYAVMRDGKPILLFECKAAGVQLDNTHSSQLYRYFSVTDARFAVLTNGTEYRFFSDLEKPNTMDSRPFLTVDLANLDELSAMELRKFAKPAFDEDAIIETATALKYTAQIRRFLGQQWQQPTEDFVRLIASQTYEGRITQAVLEQFTGLTRQALHTFINERIGDRLRSALSNTVDPGMGIAEDEEPNEVETTAEELQAFYIVRAILASTVAVERVTIRDSKTYCAVLLDDNNRKPICRLWFNGRQKYLGTFDASKTEFRNAIGSLDEIYRYADALRSIVVSWDPSVAPAPEEPEGRTLEADQEAG